MIKKIGLSCLLVLIVSLAHGQVLISLVFGDKLNSDKLEFGLIGGMNFSNLNGLEDSDFLRSFNLGFYFDIKLKNPHWKLATGVMVKSDMGANNLPVYDLGQADLDSAFVGGSVKRQIHYFYVPIMIKRLFKHNIYAVGGIQPGLRTKATDTFQNTVNSKDDLEYTVDIKDNYYRLDFGLCAGVGYKLLKGSGMNFEVRYYGGLVNVSSVDGTPSQRNQSIYLLAGIPIGAGKKPDAKK